MVARRKRQKYPPPPRIDERHLLWRRHGGRCALCGQPVRYREMTLDHILPASRGGTVAWSNMQPAHAACNQRRGNMSMDEWAQARERRPPRVGRASA